MSRQVFHEQAAQLPNEGSSNIHLPSGITLGALQQKQQEEGGEGGTVGTINGQGVGMGTGVGIARNPHHPDAQHHNNIQSGGHYGHDRSRSHPLDLRENWNQAGQPPQQKQGRPHGSSKAGGAQGDEGDRRGAGEQNIYSFSEH